jgi:short-subunit dehydrogenase
VVTGAASGIGRALALKLARENARLALCDVNEVELQKTVAMIQNMGHWAMSAKVDVSNQAAMATFANRVEQALGPVEILINNAGVALTNPFASTSPDDFEWLFQINFWGVVHGCRAFLPQLSRSKNAHIVNISSVFGLAGIPGQTAYCASKFAVRGFSEALRHELHQSGIALTVVYPGGIRTNIIHSGRHYRDHDGNELNVQEFADSFARLARTSPEQAARAIVQGIKKRRPRVLIGPDAHMFNTLSRYLPSSAGRIMSALMRYMKAKQASRTKPQPHRQSSQTRTAAVDSTSSASSRVS